MYRFLLIAVLLNIHSLRSQAQPKPKLIVGFVVDQMRWDYLHRYKDRYSKGGFNRIMQKGFSYENAHIPYTPAVTAAGHTCIYTGSVPSIHGIVGNDWIDKEINGYMYCASDRTVNSVGTHSTQGKMSPRNMLSTTVGDELRLSNNMRSKVYGVALKDRGAILPAGHSANASYWFDDSTGNWISSTYYMNQLPAWVNVFNRSRSVDSMMRSNWTSLYPMNTYLESTADEQVWEKPIYTEKTSTFPHNYSPGIGKNYYSFRQSPYGNTYTLNFAKELIRNEKLGSGTATDMLCVSLSSTDYIGHRFGPNSIEVEDTYLRLDKDLENFLNYLDRTLGVNNYLFFLSADHGAPNVPDLMKANRMPGGNLYSYGLPPVLNKLLNEKFGVNNLVRAIYEYQVYLDNRKIDSLKLDDMAIRNEIVQFLLSQPEVVNAFDYKKFSEVVIPEVIREKLTNGYYYKRSGDIQFILKPQYTDVLSSGTEHGTMYAYDTHIPLVWYGWKVKAGRSSKEVYMTDIAPTLCSMMQIQMPSGSVGKPLSDITGY